MQTQLQSVNRQKKDYNLLWDRLLSRSQNVTYTSNLNWNAYNAYLFHNDLFTLHIILYTLHTLHCELLHIFISSNLIIFLLSSTLFYMNVWRRLQYLLSYFLICYESIVFYLKTYLANCMILIVSVIYWIKKGAKHFQIKTFEIGGFFCAIQNNLGLHFSQTK